jgi:2-phospho-L-lactate guanylyltransferase
VADRTAVAATVRDHDPVSGNGSVLLDDGTALAYDAAAFAAGGLRLLRSGQRVQVELVDGAPVVVALPS